MNVISQMTTRRTRPMQRDLRVKILGPPHCGSAYIPGVGKGGCKRRESTTAYCERKRFFFYGVRRSCRRFYGHKIFLQPNGHARRTGDSPSASKIPPRRHALTSFSILSNIRLVPGGSSEMVGASRCFASNFFQLGGDHALAGLQRFSDPSLADSLCKPAPLRSATNFFGFIHGRNCAAVLLAA